MRDQTTNFIRAMLQGITGAGLFRKLGYPGAPSEFVDSRSLDEIRASGEFAETCRCFSMIGKREEQSAEQAAAAH
jgi:hypothetical protein